MAQLLVEVHGVEGGLSLTLHLAGEGRSPALLGLCTCARGGGHLLPEGGAVDLTSTYEVKM